MSGLAIALIVLGALVALVFVGGLIASRRRDIEHAGEYDEHVAAADHALEQARAEDRGWDRDALEQAARAAVAERRPDFTVERLDLVLVDDQPGVHEDRAHFAAHGPDGDVRIVLGRGDAGWFAEQVE